MLARFCCCLQYFPLPLLVLLFLLSEKTYDSSHTSEDYEETINEMTNYVRVQWEHLKSRVDKIMQLDLSENRVMAPTFGLKKG